MAALSQHKPVGVIVGTALDSANGKALQGATVALRKMDVDAKPIVLITNSDGYFSFYNLAYGYYSLEVSSVGFAILKIDSIYLRAERYDFNLGDLKLPEKSGELQNVVVYVEKPLLENKDGKVTYNAGESALSAGSTTADMLKTLPLISNDPNGKILLRGKEPRILIDDKPVDLNGQQLADLLESLPGGSIERIELMQNPPPEYGTDAGGVINIVTKKGKVGFTGRLNVSAGTRGEANIGANLSYRTSKWNVSGTVNAGASLLVGYNNSYRNNYFADSTNQLATEGNFENRNIRPNIRLQADYDYNKWHQFSLVLQTNNNWFDNESNTAFKNINRFGELWKLSVRNIASDGRGPNYNPQFTWNWKSKRQGENLRLVTSASTGEYYNDRNFSQRFLDPASLQPIAQDSLQRQLTENKYLNTQTRLSYNRPLVDKVFYLNTGAGFSTTRNDNNLASSYLDKLSNEWLTAPLLSNSFIFDQQVYYLRGGFTWQLKEGWKLVGYLQPELTSYNLVNKGVAASASNQYVNWLPGFTIRKDLNKEHNLTLVYRKSIRRPTVSELNPAVDYGDPYNWRFGNPSLSPSGAHNFDLNYGYSKGKSFFNASAGFNLVEDIIASIRTLQADGKTFVTYQNIASRKEYEAAVWSGYSFSKTVRINLSAGYTFNQYTEADKRKFGYRDGSTFYTTLNYNLTFSGVFSMDGSMRFSSYADPQGRSRSNLNSNFGIQYKFFDRRLIAAFNVIDPFTAQELTTTTYGKNFDLNSFRSSRTRNFRLTLGWQLNKVVAPKVVSGGKK